MGGAQPLAATMAGAAILCVEVDPTRIERRLETRYLDEAADSLDDALARVRAAAAERPGALGRPARERRRGRSRARPARRALRPGHRPDRGARPAERLRPGGTRPSRRPRALRERDPDEYLRRASRVDRGTRRAECSSSPEPGATFSTTATTSEGRRNEAGVEDAFTYPGFVPAYIRPLFCRGIGPFRWAVLSGDPEDIAAIDAALRRLFPDDVLLQRWLELAPERVAFQGLPARICWLGYGDRARAGLAINELVRSGQVRGPGRDRARPPRLGLGRVAVPRDRGDARRLRRDRGLADPERAPEHRGGRNLGQRPSRGRRRDRQLDPRGHGRRRGRHRRGGRAARARAHDRSGHRRPPPRRRGLRGGASRPPASTGSTLSPAARQRGAASLLVRDLAQARLTGGRRGRRCAGRTRSASSTVVEDAYVLCGEGRIVAVGRMRDLGALDADWSSSTGVGALRSPGLGRLPHACVLRGHRAAEFELRARRRHVRGAACRGRRNPVHRRGDPRRRRGGPARGRSRSTARGCSRPGRRRSRPSRATGSTARRSCDASGRRDAGGVPTWLGAHAVPPEFPDGDAYLDFALAEVLPEAAEFAEAADVFVERAPSTRRRRGATSRRAAPRGLRLRLHATSSPREEGSRSPSSSRQRASTTSRRPGPTASELSPRATSRRSSCPSRPSSSAARCRPRGRWSTRARSSRWRLTSTPVARSAKACHCVCPRLHADRR